MVGGGLGTQRQSAANLDACRRLFTGFDQADPSTKRQVITTALSRLDHLMQLVDRQLPEPPQRPPPLPLSLSDHFPLHRSMF